MTMSFKATGALFVGRQQPWCTDALMLAHSSSTSCSTLGEELCSARRLVLQGRQGSECTGGFQLYTCTAAALGNGDG